MTVSPLSREQGLAEDLMAAYELKPDVLEIRSDQISETYYEWIKTAAKTIGCSLLLTLKQPTSLFSGGVVGMLPEVEYVDLDISYFLDDSNSDSLALLLNGCENGRITWIVSFHCFEEMEGGTLCTYVDNCLSEILDIRESYGIPVIPKIAAMPKSTEDALVFLEYLRQQMMQRTSASTAWVGVPMGICSMSVRMMAASFGSLFTYAYLVEPNAPGQIPLYCLIEN